jgi:hypothetical protein
MDVGLLNLKETLVTQTSCLQALSEKIDCYQLESAERSNTNKCAINDLKTQVSTNKLQLEDAIKSQEALTEGMRSLEHTINLMRHDLAKEKRAQNTTLNSIIERLNKVEATEQKPERQPAKRKENVRPAHQHHGTPPIIDISTTETADQPEVRILPHSDPHWQNHSDPSDRRSNREYDRNSGHRNDAKPSSSGERGNERSGSGFRYKEQQALLLQKPERQSAKRKENVRPAQQQHDTPAISIIDITGTVDQPEVRILNPHRKENRSLVVHDQSPRYQSQSLDARHTKQKKTEGGRIPGNGNRASEARITNKDTQNEDIGSGFRYKKQYAMILHDGSHDDFNAYDFDRMFHVETFKTKGLKSLTKDLDRFKKVADKMKPDCIYVHLGANDLIQGEEAESVVTYYHDLAQYLLHNYSSKVCFSLIIPTHNNVCLNAKIKSMNNEVLDMVTYIRSSSADSRSRLFTFDNTRTGDHCKYVQGTQQFTNRGKKMIWLRLKDGLKKTLGLPRPSFSNAPSNNKNNRSRRSYD